MVRFSQPKVKEDHPKLAVKEIPGIMGIRKLRVRFNYKAQGERCQGGHTLPKGWYIKITSGEGDAYYDMDYCLYCAKRNGWLKNAN